MKVRDETSASRQTFYKGLDKEVEEDLSKVAEEWRELIESASVLGWFQFWYLGNDARRSSWRRGPEE